MNRTCFLIIYCSLFTCACSGGGSDRSGSSTFQTELPEHLQDIENLTVISEDMEPKYELELVRETKFGNQLDDSVYTGYINVFTVDDRGRVYLADMKKSAVHVYNPDGSFLATIGREGQGPGEFNTLFTGLDIGVNSDFLYVYDGTNFRVNRFDLNTFELEKIFNVNPETWSQVDELSGAKPFRFYFRNDGNFLVSFRTSQNSDSSRPRRNYRTDVVEYFYLFNEELWPSPASYLRHDLPLSNQTEVNGSVIYFDLPFRNREISAFSNDGSIYTASTESFLIKILNPDGSYNRSIYNPMSLISTSREDLTKFEEKYPLFRYFNDKMEGNSYPKLH